VTDCSVCFCSFLETTRNLGTTDSTQQKKGGVPGEGEKDGGELANNIATSHSLSDVLASASNSANSCDDDGGLPSTDKRRYQTVRIERRLGVVGGGRRAGDILTSAHIMPPQTQTSCFRCVVPNELSLSLSRILFLALNLMDVAFGLVMSAVCQVISTDSRVHHPRARSPSGSLAIPR
jgi:hypothetical protein